jgi:UDP-N-acetyl-D-glucosamine dehydrogenase
MSFNAQGRTVRDARILVLGLAYKRNTGDARESPAVRACQLLAARGAQVRIADPHVIEKTVLDGLLPRVQPTAAELAKADAVVLLTDHDAFDSAAIRTHAKFIFDCRRRLAGSHVESL